MEWIAGERAKVPVHGGRDPRLPFPDRLSLALACLLWMAWPQTASADDWRFDVLVLKNGATLPGLLVKESPLEIEFKPIRRRAGSPTVVIWTVFYPSEIKSIERLSPSQRQRLAERLKALDPNAEALQMERLPLEPLPGGHGKGEEFRYSSSHFVLISNAREDIVRRAAVRLEQIYAAYTRFLPPRRLSAEPTQILLVKSLEEYHALLKEQSRNILNPAFFDAAKNQIICASDLESLGAQLELVRKQHNQLLDDLRKQESSLKAQYHGAIPPAIAEQIAAKRNQIRVANRKNDDLFKDATRYLFQTLYHESFHAYLAQFVYPVGQADVPRWLNEGLAQVFETALVEAGEIRVGHADADRLQRVKAALRRQNLLSVTQLLRSGPQDFLIGHAGDQPVSERAYLSAWALAFYLTFERHVLGTPSLDRYVLALQRGADPVEAFRELAGEPLPEFERRFKEYLLDLRSDGTTARAPWPR
jgi:Protein of unknown function (DUF1570)